MSPTVTRLFFCLLVGPALALAVIACGARQGGDESDPVTLIRQGRYAEARRLARLTPDDPRSRGIIALTYVAESPTAERGKRATETLTTAAEDVRAAAAAAEMLALAPELPDPVDPEVSFALAEVALGAVSYGPYAPDATPSITVGAASRDLALAVLDRVALALDRTGGVSSARLLAIWNGCYSLTGGSFETPSDVDAWRLLQSIAVLALFVKSAGTDEDFADVLLGAAVNVIEANPTIAVAVGCDLSSPYEDLKKAMAYNREHLARLENAVRDAAGCTRGTYAPTAE